MTEEKLKHKILLADLQVQEFLVQGYLIIQTTPDKKFHDKIFKQLNQDFEYNPGNNILPVFSDLETVSILFFSCSNIMHEFHFGIF